MRPRAHACSCRVGAAPSAGSGSEASGSSSTALVRAAAFRIAKRPPCSAAIPATIPSPRGAGDRAVEPCGGARREARAPRVLDRDADAAIARRDLDPDRRRPVLDRVDEQVVERLHDPARVGDDRRGPGAPFERQRRRIEPGRRRPAGDAASTSGRSRTSRRRAAAASPSSDALEVAERADRQLERRRAIAVAAAGPGPASKRQLLQRPAQLVEGRGRPPRCAAARPRGAREQAARRQRAPRPSRAPPGRPRALMARSGGSRPPSS